MSDLAGGLVPLGSRAGSSTEGSKSTLSGGLIPLGNKSRPTASHDRLDFEGEDRDGKGGNSRGWARPEEEEENASGLRKQGSSGGLHRDEKSKRSSSSSRRRGGKDKSDRGHESSSRRESSKSSSRRRRGSKDSSTDTYNDNLDVFNADANPTIVGLGGGGDSNRKGPENDLAGVDTTGANAEGEDDSYLFMGATAGAKGNRGTGGSAAEEALNYDSTDSFGLPKAKITKGRTPGLSPNPAPSESRNETRATSAGAGSSRPSSSRPSADRSAKSRAAVESSGGPEHDGGSAHGGRPAQWPRTSDSSEMLSSNTTAASGGGSLLSTTTPAATEPQREVSRSPQDAVATATSEAGIDLYDDFDSPDEEIDELLQTTGALLAARNSASVRAPSPAPAPATATALSAVPPPSQLGGLTNSSREDRKNSSAVAADSSEQWNHTVGSSVGEPLRRTSPSPPSSPRNSRSDGLQRDYHSGQSLRSRRGRGLTYSGSKDDLGGGKVSEKGGESGPQGGRLEVSLYGGGGPAATNILEGGAHKNTAVPAGSSIGSSHSGLSSGGGRSRTISAEDEVGGGRGDEVGESGLRAFGSDLEGPASVGRKMDGDVAASVNGEGEANDDTRHELASSGSGIVPKSIEKASRRSALAGSDKSKAASRHAKSSRGVTFDDDLVGVDALDILPGSSSDEDDKRGDEALPAAIGVSETASPIIGTSAPTANFPAQQSPVAPAIVSTVNTAVVGIDGDGDGIAGSNRVSATRVAASSGEMNRSSSTAMTEGLSPAAARLMAEDSSSEDRNAPRAVGASTIGSLLGLEDPGPAASSAGRVHLNTGAEATHRVGMGPEDDGGKGGEDVITIDDAKLELALGFTPSVMEGGRKPRRTLPAGRRRRTRGGVSPPTAEGEGKLAGFPVATTKRASIPSASIPSTTSQALGRDMITQQEDVTCKTSKLRNSVAEAAALVEVGVAAARGKGAGDVRGSRLDGVPGSPSTLSSPAGKSVVTVFDAPLVVTAESTAGTGVESSSSAPESHSLALPMAKLSSVALPGTSNSSASGATHGASFSSFDSGPRHGSSNNRSTDTAYSKAKNSTETRSVDASVLASLERQLVLLTGEKEAVVAKSLGDEKRFRRDSDQAREAAAAAHARAFELEAALAVARARVRQLEAEDVDNTARLAAVEARAVSEMRAEQESCLRNISDAETRHQASPGLDDGLRKAENRHREALAELKRLHKEELEDTRRRNSDSKTLEALAGQVQASAGAVKLLQSEMMERRNVSEVSREGHMEARERLIKELEQSARRAQQARHQKTKKTKNEVQRLQGTLMSMEQVMSALRGQNAGERERLRQEHLRMEALQGAMVAEVEAIRKSVEEERQRLADRCAALDMEKRQAGAAARAESDRLTEQRIKLEADRESFSSLQVSASQAAEEMARRHAGEEERLKNARQSLEREASSLEARLSCAREDLHKADHVRESLDHLRDQDELERRRLKAVAGELERAFEEVRTRTEDSNERWREAESMKSEALAASKKAIKEKEATQLRSVQVEEAARRLEAERTSIAQARAQSATELSSTRRLKAELSRAFAFQQRQQAKGMETATDIVLSTRSASLGQHAGGGDTGAGLGVGFDRQGFGAGTMGTKMPGLPLEADSGSASAGPGRSSATYPPPPDNAAGGVGIPFTGIAAAEATLQAISSTPPFPGLDVGRELGRLARRAADLRECTREQTAFLSFSRAARFSSAPQEFATITGNGQESLHLFAGSPSALNISSGEAASRWTGVDTVLAHQIPGRQGWSGGVAGRHDLGALGIGMSSTVLEELDKIEQECSKRSSALKDEEPFVNTLGRAESPVAV
ncbi:unnamed protein product [Pylaiella littoralis]